MPTKETQIKEELLRVVDGERFEDPSPYVSVSCPKLIGILPFSSCSFSLSVGQSSYNKARSLLHEDRNSAYAIRNNSSWAVLKPARVAVAMWATA